MGLGDRCARPDHARRGAPDRRRRRRGDPPRRRPGRVSRRPVHPRRGGLDGLGVDGRVLPLRPAAGRADPTAIEPPSSASRDRTSRSSSRRSWRRCPSSSRTWPAAGASPTCTAAAAAGWWPWPAASRRIELVGVEFEADSAARARATIEAEGLSDRITIREAKVTEPGKEGTLDLVYFQYALHQLPDAAAALRAAWHALRPGGRVLVLDWPLPSSQDEFAHAPRRDHRRRPARRAAPGDRAGDARALPRLVRRGRPAEAVDHRPAVRCLGLRRGAPRLTSPEYPTDAATVRRCWPTRRRSMPSPVATCATSATPCCCSTRSTRSRSGTAWRRCAGRPTRPPSIAA